MRHQQQSTYLVPRSWFLKGIRVFGKRAGCTEYVHDEPVTFSYKAINKKRSKYNDNISKGHRSQLEGLTGQIWDNLSIK